MNYVLALGGATALLLALSRQSGGGGQLGNWDEKYPLKSLDQIPAKGVDVPFQLVKDNPVLPVRLEGDNYLTCWIVDSGYGFSAVDKRLADRLKLPRDGHVAMQTLEMDRLESTRVPRGWVYDRQTDTPDLEMPMHRAVIRDLPFTLDDTFGGAGNVCMRAGGILGITFLQHFVTRIDYRAQRITFYDPRTFQYRGRGGHKFTRWLPGEQYFLVPVKINGVTANMALDTGAFANIMTRGFLEKYRRTTGRDFQDSGKNSGKVRASFSENVLDLQRKRVGQVEVADYMFPNLEVLYPADGHTPGLLDTTRFDGLLGYPVLHNFVIYLVYEPKPYVILEPQL